MSVAVSAMPLAPGDVNHRINTPAVMPPANAFGTPFDSIATMDAATAPSSPTDSPNGAGARRPSAGAAFAEAVGIDLNAIGRGASMACCPLCKLGAHTV